IVRQTGLHRREHRREVAELLQVGILAAELDRGFLAVRTPWPKKRHRHHAFLPTDPITGADGHIRFVQCRLRLSPLRLSCISRKARPLQISLTIPEGWRILPP